MHLTSSPIPSADGGYALNPPPPFSQKQEKGEIQPHPNPSPSYSLASSEERGECLQIPSADSGASALPIA